MCAIVGPDVSTLLLLLPSAFRPAAENCDDMPSPSWPLPEVEESRGNDVNGEDATDGVDEFSECARAAGIAYNCGTVIIAVAEPALDAFVTAMFCG